MEEANKYHDPREADLAYVAFPNFVKWQDSKVDLSRWNRYRNRLESVATADPKILERARHVVQRVAAVETGAIEELYEVDRGFTLTIATESALWESALSDRGKDATALIRSQLDAYDHVIDFATGSAPFVLAWIRELHTQLCKGQEFYLVQTEAGPQKQELPLGRYKILPNHVIAPDGSLHAYAPVDMVAAEMQRLLRQIKSKAFGSAHPALQAAYVHYGIVAIHPFADGNGRMARALASVFTYREASIPYLVLSEDRESYFDALANADAGDVQSFVDFSFERCLSAIELVEQSMRTAQGPGIDKTLAGLGDLYVTSGGYAQEQVDTAATVLMQRLQNEFVPWIDNLKTFNGISNANSSLQSGNYPVISDNYRLLLSGGGQSITIVVSSKPPAAAQAIRRFNVEVPKDCGKRDDILIHVHGQKEIFTARVDALIPAVRSALVMRLQMFAEEMIKQLADELVAKARSARQTM